MSASSWALTLACNRADAEAMPEIGDVFPDLVDPPTLNVEEPDPDKPDDWLMTAYFAGEPDPALVARITALFPSASDVQVAALADEDWTTLSQRGLEPVRAGRFVVHTAAHSDAVRTGDIGIAIEAGLAFGTGQHATTHGCLLALHRLGKQRGFSNIADLGTGTGVLAIAAARRWEKRRALSPAISTRCLSRSRAAISATMKSCRVGPRAYRAGRGRRDGASPAGAARAL